MPTITIEGQVYDSRQQLLAMRRAVAAASRLIAEDFRVKASGGTGASGVKWPRLSAFGQHTRAARTSAGRANLQARRVLTEREKILLSPYRGTGRLPLGSDAYNTLRRRRIIGHEVCNTVEYRAIKAERATLRAGMRSLEEKAAEGPVGVVSKALFDSFRVGTQGCKVEVSELSATLSSGVKYAAAFDAKRQLIPASIPKEWSLAVSEEYFRGD